MIVLIRRARSWGPTPVALLLVTSACAPMPVEQKKDELGCIVPSADVFVQSKVSVRLANLGVTKMLSAEGVQLEHDPEVRDLLSQSARDRALRDYIECRMQFDPRNPIALRAWFASYHSFLSKNPTPAEIMDYLKQWPMPLVGDKVVGDTRLIENMTKLLSVRSKIAKESFIDFSAGWVRDPQVLDSAYTTVVEVEAACPELRPSCEVVTACICAASDHVDHALERLGHAESLAATSLPKGQDYFFWTLGGFAYASIGRYSEARRFFENACRLGEQDPKLGDADMLANVAKAILMGHDEATDYKHPLVVAELKIADEYLRRAIANRPSKFDFHINMVAIQRRLGRLPEALREAETSVALGPNQASAHFNKGTVLNDMGRFKEAEVALTEALKIKPNHHKALINRCVARRAMGDAKGAKEDALAAIGFNGGAALAHYMLAVLLQESGQDTEAMTEVDMALARNNLYGPAHYLRARLFASRGDSESRESARKEFETAIIICPGDHFFHNEYGNLLADMGLLAESLEAYGKAIAAKPDYAEAYWNRGLVLKEMGREGDAESDFQHARRINPKIG